MTTGVHGGLRFADKAVIAVAWVATCGLVYLFGFYLGKGMQEVRYGKEERVVRLPVESEVPPAGSGAPKTPSYEFYDNLAGHQRGRGAEGAPMAPAPGPAVSGAGPAPSVTVPPAVPAPTQPQVPPRPAPGGPAESAVGTAKPGLRLARPTPGPAQPTPPGPRPEASQRPPGQSASGGRGWTVRTRPLPSSADAEALGARLRARGYAARVVQVRRDGKLEYVLVVGRYGTAGQAGEVMRKLRTEHGVAQAFVASE